MLLTTDEFRMFADTALEDDALQLLLDAAETEITRAAGAAGSTVELAGGGGHLLTLARPAESITSVTETVHTTVTTLAADDYYLHPGGYIIERLNTGTNARWRWWGRVTVTSVPVDDDALRKGVQHDLLNLMLNFQPGVSSETIGAWSQSLGSNAAWNNNEERKSILDRLYPEPGMVVVGSGYESLVRW